MADNTINVKIREAYDTETSWNSKNPVLLQGQIAISSDKHGMYKVGDGTKTWQQLDYASHPASDVYSWAKAQTKPSYTKSEVGLGNVDNTSDANKPISTATQAALDAKQATITGAATTITGSNLTASRALVSNSSGKVAVSAVTSTELGYLDGVTSAIQTQLNGKQATITGGATTITSNDLTASRALVSDSSGKVAVSAVTSTELGYLDGVTSSIQTQLNGKQASITGGATTITQSDLTASRALISNASGKVAVSDVTSTELGYLDGVTQSIQTQLNGKAASGHNHDSTYLKLAGGTMTGVLTLKGNQYSDSFSSGGLDANNSNLYNVNSIYFADAADATSEGLQFYRDSTHADVIRATGGRVYFTPNRKLGEAGTSYEMLVLNPDERSKIPDQLLDWGTMKLSGGYNYGDSLINTELSANRFAGLKAAGITIEYSRDSGDTWTDYGATDLQKRYLFTEAAAAAPSFRVGGASGDTTTAGQCQLRVTIDTATAVCYTNLRKLHIYISTSYSNGSKVTIKCAQQSDPNTYNLTLCEDQPIAGWSGWNVIPCNITTYGNQAAHYRKIQFTFKTNGVTQDHVGSGLTIYRIRGYGGVGWSSASNMALNGKLYQYKFTDGSSNPHLYVPTEIESTNYTGKVNGFTIGTSVPADAKFTDTVALGQMTGVLQVAHGGTGKDNANDAANVLLNGLGIGSSTPVDADYYISQYVGGGTTTTTYHRRPMSALWSYIKGKTDANYLKLTGGTVTGPLTLYREGTTAQDYPAQLVFSVKDTTTGKQYSAASIDVHNDHTTASATYGTNMVIHSDGNIFLGSGEAPGSHYALYKGNTSENTFISADGAIHIQANANTIGNRLGVQINTAGALLPEKADTATNNSGSIGNSSYKWADVYATNLHGNLTGNVTGNVTGDVTGNASSATTATTATTSDKLKLPRVNEDANHLPGKNTFLIREYQNTADHNLPSTHWYHIYEAEGSDAGYSTQLALGMTTDKIAYRRYASSSWGNWQTIYTTSNKPTASDVGLGNVENKSSATIRGELTSSNVTTALGFTPVNKAGDTMSSSLNITKAGETGVEVNNTAQAHKVGFIVGQSGNGGIYDRTNSKWIVYSTAAGDVVLNGTANTATNVQSAGAATANASRHVWFSDSGTETKRAHDDDFKYNPSTNVLTVGSINGSATLTGTPTAPTAATGTNTTQIATTAFVNSSVDALEVGGRNLLKDSHKAVSNGSYATVDYYFGDRPPLEDEIVTLQVKGTLASTKTSWQPYNSGGSVSAPGLKLTTQNYDSTTGIYTATGQWKVGAASNTYLRLYAMTQSQSGTSSIEWVKLERGDKATDWTLAPEDVITGLSISGKTITYKNQTGQLGTLTTQDTVALGSMTGTLGVGHGGTGATTFTSGALLIGNGDSAVGTRAIKNMTSAGNLGWTSATTDIYIPTVNTLAYWNGRYNSSASNLAYCSKGAFGNLAVKDSLTKSDVGLGNVDNKSQATIRGEITSDNVCSALGYAPVSKEGDYAVRTEFIYGTQTASTNAWTGVTSDAALYDGKEIIYFLPFAGTSTATTLNLTLSGGGTTGAKAVYFNSTSRHTTHYGQYQMIRMVYHKSLTIGSSTNLEGWWIDYARDTNDTAYNTYMHYSGFKTSAALKRYMICIQDDVDSLLPMNGVDNGYNSTTKALTTASFMPFGAILFYNSTGAVDSNAVIPNGRLYDSLLIDLRYSFNIGTTLTANKAVYIVAVPQSDGKAKLHATTPISQTLPTTADGNYYIYLGMAYSTYQVTLPRNFHPVFMYANSAVREISQYAPYAGDAATVTGHTVAKDVPSNALFTDHTYTAATAAPGDIATTGAQGSSSNYARQDHTHGISLATGDSNGQVKIAGENVDVKGLGALAYKASLSKSDVGLGNVDNKSSATIRGEITSQNVTTALGYTPVNKTGDTMSGALTLSAGAVTAQVGAIVSGTDTLTSESQVHVKSKSGSMYMYSTGNSSGNGARGIWLPAHGTGSAKYAFTVDTNNNVTFNGSLSGAASSNVLKSGDTMTGQLALKPASGEGGQICLDASTAQTTQGGIYLDQLNSSFRIFGKPSSDGSTCQGSGTILTYYPYNSGKMTIGSAMVMTSAMFSLSGTTLTITIPTN